MTAHGVVAMCILMVDDEPLILTVMADFLRQAGREVWTAGDVNAAMGLVIDKPSQFTCLVTDYSMPGLTGADLIILMRRTHPQIPMVLATASGYAVTNDWRVMNNVWLLVKPFGGRELVGVVSRLLSQM